MLESHGTETCVLVTAFILLPMYVTERPGVTLSRDGIFWESETVWLTQHCLPKLRSQLARDVCTFETEDKNSSRDVSRHSTSALPQIQ